MFLLLRHTYLICTNQNLESLGNQECYQSKINAILHHFESSFEQDNKKFRVMGTLNGMNGLQIWRKCLYFHFTSWRRHEWISCRCKQRLLDGLFKPSGARNCDNRVPLLQQIAFTFTNTESVRVYYGYQMTLNNNWFSNLQTE